MDQWQVAEGSLGRVLDRDLFLFLFDLEIKRAKRYQNFISLLFLRISRVLNDDKLCDLGTCRETLGDLLSVEMRESDLIASLGDDRLVVLLPYADTKIGEQAKTRFEETLQYFDFRKKGFQIAIDQFCFPTQGADTADFVNKLLPPN